eukprot:CAMPEP_0206607290 /NCGR_PEP_ID=MMETSP0325_2-20121206/52041_1 /ASSEMBLY_ACC=CAM_ASM_000347 /TAXON_ID=2866 /ORGANISM="Crypthecodinium cohnii, Strain Seligo" /LENGTH=35 /DNA_ID= /DNA_START= /DNA_END= /DNA_ORIENTATION=
MAPAANTSTATTGTTTTGAAAAALESQSWPSRPLF